MGGVYHVEGWSVLSAPVCHLQSTVRRQGYCMACGGQTDPLAESVGRHVEPIS